MKKIIQLVAVFVTLLFLGGVAVAFDETDHVNVSPNNEGQTALWPIYHLASDGWATKLKVVNTSNTDSVVMKVVVRSPKYSVELLDFLIYLSPNDVWTGYLDYGPGYSVTGLGTGPRMYSEDGSCLTHLGTWASAADPMRILLQPAPACGDTNTQGYVYAITAGTCAIPKTAGGVVLKPAILTAYSYFPLANGTVSPAWNTGTAIPNIINASFEYGSEVAGILGGASAVLLRDFDNVTKLTLGGDTPLSSTRNSFGEVEAALSLDNMAMPYSAANLDSGTLQVWNFPTKRSSLNTTTCKVTAYPSSPFWTANDAAFTGCIKYNADVYDPEENRSSSTWPFSPAPSNLGSWCDEVSSTYITGSGTFTEGWIRYSGAGLVAATITPWANPAPVAYPGGVAYVGIPVIPVIVQWTQTAGGGGLAISYPGWDQTFVYGITGLGAAVQLPNYQFTNVN